MRTAKLETQYILHERLLGRTLKKKVYFLRCASKFKLFLCVAEEKDIFFPILLLPFLLPPLHPLLPAICRLSSDADNPPTVLYRGRRRDCFYCFCLIQRKSMYTESMRYTVCITWILFVPFANFFWRLCYNSVCNLVALFSSKTWERIWSKSDYVSYVEKIWLCHGYGMMLRSFYK